MLFIGVALVVAVGLALLISADAGHDARARPVRHGAAGSRVSPFLILVAGGLFTRRQRLGEMLGNLVLWVGIFAVAIGIYAYRNEFGDFGNRVMAELTPGAAVVDVDTGTATFRRSFGGSFRINAAINGHENPYDFRHGRQRRRVDPG